MTRQEIYIEFFKKYFGYREDYYPEDDYEKIATGLDSEVKLKMPTDTASREKQGDAVMVLVTSHDREAELIGIKLGNRMIENDEDKTGLLNVMAIAAKKLHELQTAPL